jgi:DNA-directed RNA polymerase specialized sigma24 family protein
MKRPPANYTPDEVEAIVEGYQEFCAQRTRPLLQVRLLDVEAYFTRLPRLEREALLFHGVAALTLDEIRERSGVPTQTTLDRYESGIKRLTYLMNRGGR